MDLGPGYRQAGLQTLAAASHRPHDPRYGLVFERGQGARLWTVDGTCYFDLTCGFSATNFGHCFPPLVEAAAAQLTELSHLTGELHRDKLQLAERLLHIMASQWSCSPDELRVQFNTTGARAIETAWKAAAALRPGKLLVISPGFHGRSIATSAISHTLRGLPNLEPGSFQVHPEGFPYCGHCPLHTTYPACNLRCADSLLDYVAREAVWLSAVLVEPAIGARGYLFPPDAFFQRLRERTRQHGILMIADEVQTGLGRCGDWLLSQLQGWRPDLLVLGKSLGGGIAPISAVVGRADVLNAIPAGVESETFAGSPLACRVALSVLEQLSEGPWMRQGRQVGQQLRKLASDFPIAVEGRGATCVLELAGARTSAQPVDGPPPTGLHEASRSAERLAAKLFAAGLLVHHSGPFRTRIVLLPPLTLADEELAAIIQRLRHALDEWRTGR